MQLPPPSSPCAFPPRLRRTSAMAGAVARSTVDGAGATVGA